MARIRTIKPEFFTSEDIVSLSPLARLLYIATWLEADREGRLVWKPKTFKLRFLPGDNCEIEDLTAELVTKGLVIVYEADGEILAEIPTFSRHQVINNRERSSTIPARVADASITRKERVKGATVTRASGRERKGREGNEYALDNASKAASESRTASRFDSFWQAWPAGPRKQAKVECEKKWIKMRLDDIADAVLDHLSAVSKTTQFMDFTPAPLTYINQRRWEDGLPILNSPSTEKPSPIFKGAL